MGSVFGGGGNIVYSQGRGKHAESGGDTVYRAPSPKGIVCVCLCVCVDVCVSGSSLFMGGNGIIVKGKKIYRRASVNIKKRKRALFILPFTHGRTTRCE